MITPGLSRITSLLAHTPLPWSSIHVAGTNGKGSVCATVSALLDVYNASALRRTTGHPPLRHGRFTSPHLVERRDSVCLDSAPVDARTFADVEARVLARNAGIGASEFECLTATAYEVFTHARADLAVVEVGMGGRLDATNVLGRGRGMPLATAVTDVGMDHVEFLGNTLGEIAAEKAGIIKTGVPVVMAEQDPEVLDVVRRKAEEEAVGDLVVVGRKTTLGDVWRQNGEGGDELGEHGERVVQNRWANGAIALQLTWKALKGMGRLDGTPVGMRAGLMREFGDAIDKVVWHGRLEQVNMRSIVGYDCNVVLDGAHNADSARMLRRYLDSTASGQCATSWIVGSSSVNKVGEILNILVRPKDSVHAVEFGSVDGMPWIKPVRDQAVVDIAEKISDPSPQEHKACGLKLEDALKQVCKEAVELNRQVVVTGSLYLVGEIYKLLKEQSAEV